MKTDLINPLPPITVLIPVHNLASYLPDTLKSVLGQTYSGKISIVILDDGSTDCSLQVARDLAKQHQFISIHTQVNQGRAKTRNRLLELAETELIAWIDGDDIASPDWLLDQVGYLHGDTSCVAVGGQGYAMTGNRNPIGPIPHPLQHKEIHQRHLEGQANAFFQSCVTVRKTAVIDAGCYDERFDCAEDYSLWLRLERSGELRNMDATHLYYRVHATSANWTVNIEQRKQGQQILNEQRALRLLQPLNAVDTVIPPLKKDDWNRRIFWINLALKSGNPISALEMLSVALKKHPNSLVLWMAACVSILDAIIGFGNQSKRFAPGHRAIIGKLGHVSFYRAGRYVNRIRRKLRAKLTSGNHIALVNPTCETTKNHDNMDG